MTDNPATANAKPLRILHLTAGSDAGGVSRYILDLCTAMHADGHQVAIAGERGFSHSLFAQAPWPWIDAPLKGSYFALRRARKILAGEIESRGFDVIHTHYRRSTLVARRLQKEFGLPVLYTVHLPQMPLNLFRRSLTDFGDHAHVPSSEALKWVKEEGRVGADRVSLIPHGIDPARFPRIDAVGKAAIRSSLGVPLDATLALFVGRFDDQKNPLWFIEVARLAKKSDKPALFIMMGSGPIEAQVFAAVDREDLASDLKVVPYGDPLPLYHAADAVLIPSQREGFSYVCAEAMSTGLPVLRTKTGGTSEMILENQTGQSTPVDLGAFTSAALKFLDLGHDRLAEMGRRGAEHIRENFTFARQYQQTLNLYRKLANRTAPH